MKRTTVFLDEPLLRRARQLAQSEGKSFAALVREAVAAYVAGDRAAPGVPGIAGTFASGAADISERVDDLLWSDPHA